MLDVTRKYVRILLIYLHFKFFYMDIDSGPKMPKHVAYMKYVFILDDICLFTEYLLLVKTRPFY